MVDLDEPNTLSPKNRCGRAMLKLVFGNVQQLLDVRKQLVAVINKNQARQAETAGRMILEHDVGTTHVDPLSSLVDMREYDVPYLVRVCTDLDTRAGAWYTAVTPNPLDLSVSRPRAAGDLFFFRRCGTVLLV